MHLRKIKPLLTHLLLALVLPLVIRSWDLCSLIRPSSWGLALTCQFSRSIYLELQRLLKRMSKRMMQCLRTPKIQTETLMRKNPKRVAQEHKIKERKSTCQWTASPNLAPVWVEPANKVVDRSLLVQANSTEFYHRRLSKSGMNKVLLPNSSVNKRLNKLFSA